MRRNKVTPTQYPILKVLSKANCLTNKEITYGASGKLTITYHEKQRIRFQLHYLVDKGWIKKSKDENCNVVFSLTPLGTQALANYEEPEKKAPQLTHEQLLEEARKAIG